MLSWFSRGTLPRQDASNTRSCSSTSWSWPWSVHRSTKNCVCFFLATMHTGSPKTMFSWFFCTSKDYCFSTGLKSTIPEDYSFNGLWLTGYGVGYLHYLQWEGALHSLSPGRFHGSVNTLEILIFKVWLNVTSFHVDPYLHQWFASSCNTSGKKASHHRRACFSKNTALVSCCICIMYPHIFSPTSSTTSLAQATRAFTRDAKRSISSLGSPLSVVKTFWLQLLGRLSKATARGLVKGGIFRYLQEVLGDLESEASSN